MSCRSRPAWNRPTAERRLTDSSLRSCDLIQTGKLGLASLCDLASSAGWCRQGGGSREQGGGAAR